MASGSNVDANAVDSDPAVADPSYDYHYKIEPAGPGGAVYARAAPLPIAEHEYEYAESAGAAGAGAARHGIERAVRSPSGYELRPPRHMRATEPVNEPVRAPPASDEGYEMPDLAGATVGRTAPMPGDSPALPPVSDEGYQMPDGVPSATSATGSPAHDTYGAAAMLTTTQSRCGYVSSRGDCRNRIIPGSLYCAGHTCVVPGPTGPCRCAKSTADSDCGAHG